MNRSTKRPSVVFLCVSNAGKSQMAEALMRLEVGDSVEIHSAGTDPKAEVNGESAASVAELGAEMSNAQPKGLDAVPLSTADRVIIVGRSAQLDPPAEMKATVERWETAEPSERGIEGSERMNMIRDEIHQRVKALVAELQL